MTATAGFILCLVSYYIGRSSGSTLWKPPRLRQNANQKLCKGKQTTMAKFSELGTSYPPEKVFKAKNVGWVMLDKFDTVICDEWGEPYQYPTREAAEAAIQNYTMEGKAANLGKCFTPYGMERVAINTRWGAAFEIWLRNIWKGK